MAPGAARALSGVALWPRLVLDPAGKYVCESRGPRGEHQKSHWQTVLPLMASRPVSVDPESGVVRATLSVDLQDGKVTSPLRYLLEGEVA